jgi:hypothetical protein
MLSAWADTDDDATLRRMADEGFTASQIAAAVGRSRSAVCGRAHRLKIQLGLSNAGARHGDRPAKVTKPKRPAPPSRRHASTPQPVPIVPARAPALVAGPVDLERLAPRACRYIAGDPRLGGAMFCGALQAPGSAYCPPHRRLCYVPRAPISRSSTPESLP